VNAIRIPFQFKHYQGQAEETALLDSGATENFMDFKTVCQHRLGTKKLIVPRPVYNVDGMPNIHGTITQTCKLYIRQGNKEAKQTFYVTNLGKKKGQIHPRIPLVPVLHPRYRLGKSPT